MPVSLVPPECSCQGGRLSPEVPPPAAAWGPVERNLGRTRCGRRIRRCGERKICRASVAMAGIGRHGTRASPKWRRQATRPRDSRRLRSGGRARRYGDCRSSGCGASCEVVGADAHHQLAEVAPFEHADEGCWRVLQTLHHRLDGYAPRIPPRGRIQPRPFPADVQHMLTDRRHDPTCGWRRGVARPWGRRGAEVASSHRRCGGQRAYSDPAVIRRNGGVLRSVGQQGCVHGRR